MTENEKKLNRLIDTLIDLVDTIEYSDIVSSEKFLEFDNAGAEIIDCIEDLKEYRAIGTIEELQALKEKNEPKKIKGKRFVEAICPWCESELFETYWAFGGIHYCSNCGSAIDWQ